MPLRLKFDDEAWVIITLFYCPSSADLVNNPLYMLRNFPQKQAAPKGALRGMEFILEAARPAGSRRDSGTKCFSAAGGLFVITKEFLRQPISS